MSRKEEIKARLDKISRCTTPLFEEEMLLNTELEQLKAKEVVENGILGRVQWTFDVDTSDGRVDLVGPRNYKPDELFNWMDWEHGHVSLASFDLSDFESLNDFDKFPELVYCDGEAFLRFENSRQFIEYRDRWNLNVDYSRLDKALAKAHKVYDELVTLKKEIAGAK